MNWENRFFRFTLTCELPGSSKSLASRKGNSEHPEKVIDR